MKRFIVRLLIAAILWPSIAPLAWGTTYYVRDCGTGHEGSCTAGDDTKLGTSDANAWQNCSKVQAMITSAASAPAGTQVLFAKGGAWDTCAIAPAGALAGATSGSNPIVFGSFDPATGGTNVPILSNATASVFRFVDSGNADPDIGITIQDLHLKGAAGNGTPGIIFGNDVDYITLQRLEIELFDIGVQITSAQTNALNTGTDGIISHVTLRDSNIHNNYSQGWLGFADDVLIENNTFTNNGGKSTTSDHQIYADGSTLLGAPRTAKQFVVRGNTFTDNNSYRTSDGLFTAGRCASVAIITHGHGDGFIVRDNIVKETSPSTNSGCWGIAVDAGYNITSSGIKDPEGYNFADVSGNHVINYDVGIGLDICQHCRAVNNWVYSAAAASKNPDGMRMRMQYNQFGTTNGDITSDRDFYPHYVEMSNNSVYLADAGTTSVGIRWTHNSGEAASLWALLGSNHVNANNLIVLLGSSVSTTTQCFNFDNITASRFAFSDNNQCYSTAAVKWTDTRSLATWRSDSGLDGSSITTDPSITTPSSGNAFSLAIPTGSTAKNAGSNTHCQTLSIFGRVRSTADASCDIGAYEFGASTDAAPQPPTRITVQ